MGWSSFIAFKIKTRKKLYERLLPGFLQIQIILFGLVFLKLSHLHCANLKRQSEQGDEAVCIVVIVKIAGGEGCQGLAV